MKREDLDDAFLAFLVIAVAASMTLSTCEGDAQPRLEREALALHRITAHEATRFTLADADGIYSVIRHAAEHLSVPFLAAARAESPLFFAGRPGDMNAWTATLTLECERPPAFRATWVRIPVGWTVSRRDACLALAAHVRAIVGGPAICDATEWGSEADYERRREQGCTWTPVDCGPGRNRFSRNLRCPR